METFSQVNAAMAEARNCALVMFESAAHIQNELPNVQMNDALRMQTEKVCNGLVGTKHDIITELNELDELFDLETSPAVNHSRFDLIIRWFWDDIDKMHQLVTALQKAGTQDPECASAHVLLAESATNIIAAFTKAKIAVNSLRLEVDYI